MVSVFSKATETLYSSSRFFLSLPRLSRLHFYQQSQGNVGFFYHMPQNSSNPYLLPTPKGVPSFLSGCDNSTPFPGTKICISLLQRP